MKFEKIHNKGQARLFKNKHLELLTKTHPLVIWGLYLPVIIFLFYYSLYQLKVSVIICLIVSFLGIFVWSFFEYFLHRFVFHFIAESEKAKKIVYIIHGNHHHYPRDKDRLFMPPVPSLILAALFFGIFYFVFGLLQNNGLVFTFFAGFLFGYLIYGTMHFAIHAFNPPFKWMKPLWRNHHLHHYKNHNKGFGVSTTLWDRLFGTMFDIKKENYDNEKVKY